jgi:hypothetical protein
VSPLLGRIALACVGEQQRQRIYEGMCRAIARGLTHHLLAFSRRRPVNPESIDIAADLTRMREMLQRSLRGDIRVEMTFGTGLWRLHRGMAVAGCDPAELGIAPVFAVPKLLA